MNTHSADRHCKNRSGAAGQEKHRRRAPGGCRNGWPWLFMDKGLPDLPDRHYRATAWALALPGKHVLAVPERADAAGGF